MSKVLKEFFWKAPDLYFDSQHSYVNNACPARQHSLCFSRLLVAAGAAPAGEPLRGVAAADAEP